MADDDDDLYLAALESFEQTQGAGGARPSEPEATFYRDEPVNHSNEGGQAYQPSDADSGTSLNKRKEQEPPNGDQPVCHCGLETVLLTSQSARNPGRNFYKCPKPQHADQCNFFVWMDELSSSSNKKRQHTPTGNTPPSQNSYQRPPQPSNNSAVPDYFGRFGGPSPAPLPGPGSAGPTANGEVLCECGVPALMLTSKTAKNPDRQFYKCENRDRPCKYFAWADQLGTPAAASQGSGPRTAGYQSTGGSTYNAAGYPSTGGSTYNAAGAVGQNTSSFQGGKAGAYSSTTPPNNPPYNGGADLDRSGDVCFKCNQTGHWASSCPNAGADSRSGAGGGATGRGNCYICQGEGHWASECPQKQAGSYGGGRGYGGGAGGGGGGGSGGGYGGSSYGSASKSYGGGGNGGASNDRPCYNCGQTGHWASSCPSKRTGGGGSWSAGGGRGRW